MKKTILLLLIIIFMIVPLVAADAPSNPLEASQSTGDVPKLQPKGWWNDLWSGSHLTYDLYVRSVLLNHHSLNYGGGLSLGVKTSNLRVDTYFQGDYFLKPLGGEGGAAKMEFDLEPGISLYWKFIKFWNFDTYVGCDIGYYAQFVKTHYQPDYFTLGFNGLMIRPKLYTELNIGNWYGLSLAVFYQLPVYPSYSDYRGLGILFSFV